MPLKKPAESAVVAEHKSLVRFITCGSSGDGKSTLLDSLCSDSRMSGSKSEYIGSSLLGSALAVERGQGVISDIAYGCFSTGRRKFIALNTLAQGHEQHMRNMVAGLSSADVAILMVDAQKGINALSRRQVYLAAQISVRHLVITVNKMDLVDYCEGVFQQIVEGYQLFAEKIGIEQMMFIPMSASKGENVATPSEQMPWYNGPSLVDYLNAVEVDDERSARDPLRLAVCSVDRSEQGYCRFSGQLCSGSVKPGHKIRVLPLGKESTVSRIETIDGDLDEAVAGQSVTFALADAIDLSRGDLIVASDQPASVAKQFETRIIWMHVEPLLSGRAYLMQIGTQTVSATVTDIKYQVNVDTLEHMAAKKLELNMIGVCSISLDKDIAFDPYQENRDTGSFILLDRLTNKTLGAGLINFALRRSHNITMQHVDVTREARANHKLQKPCILWLTGLSGAGKSTIANLVEQKLFAMGRHTYLLDGDNVRHGLNKDLGFTDADRVENIRRISEVAKLMMDAGLIVITAFISPFRSERRMARELVAEKEFVEIYVNTPLDIAEQRDVKGLYKKARNGELKNFTGIDSPYEKPESPECDLLAAECSAEDCADQVVSYLQANGYVE
ncbi:adenylyl-sulfate kinase [Neptuniibacter sp.]|uniref:adenylyl-sulfate kinase n=1 Tax=Neptuniibacter sp. TaxID=1962643 RepID=UPI002606DAFF|nr:adenylyl-sulfate kinase [Neptuniibacter sp.]